MCCGGVNNPSLFLCLNTDRHCESVRLVKTTVLKQQIRRRLGFLAKGSNLCRDFIHRNPPVCPPRASQLLFLNLVLLSGVNVQDLLCLEVTLTDFYLLMSQVSCFPLVSSLYATISSLAVGYSLKSSFFFNSPPESEQAYFKLLLQDMKLSFCGLTGKGLTVTQSLIYSPTCVELVV